MNQRSLLQHYIHHNNNFNRRIRWVASRVIASISLRRRRPHGRGIGEYVMRSNLLAFYYLLRLELGGWECWILMLVVAWYLGLTSSVYDTWRNVWLEGYKSIFNWIYGSASPLFLFGPSIPHCQQNLRNLLSLSPQLSLAKSGNR